MTNYEPGGRSEQPTSPQDPDNLSTHEDVEPISVVSGASHLLAMVPHLIGYLPSRSVVILATRDLVRPGQPLRSQLFFTCRLDLPPDPHDLPEMVAMLASPLRQAVQARGGDGPVRFHVYCYDCDRDEAASLQDPLVELATDLRAVLSDVYAVREGRFLALPGGMTDPADQWLEVPAARDVPAVADMVLKGRAPVASREDYVSMVTRRDEKAAAATELALTLRSADPEEDPLERPLRALGDWVVHAEPAPGPADRALIALVLADRVVRDGVLARWTAGLFRIEEVCPAEEVALIMRTVPAWPDKDKRAVHRLFELAGQLPRDLTAPVQTIAGFVAWAAGEGTLANAAAEEALAVDPGYRMAHYLSMALAAGLPPQDPGAGGSHARGNRAHRRRHRAA